MVKRNGLKNYKQVKTPRMSNATKKRQTERAAALAEKFGKSKRSIERCVWQDEKDFTLEVPINHHNSRVYEKKKKGEVPASSLVHQKNKQSKKVMVPAYVSWYDATKPFFVNNNKIKLIAKSYHKHLEKQLIPEI